MQQKLQQLQQQAADEWQQQHALWDAATALLSWCTAARWLWSSRNATGSSTSSFALRCVQLAATVARCPSDRGSDSSTTASSASSAAEPRAVCNVVCDVVDRALLLLAKPRPQGSCALRDHLLNSTELMALCLALLLPVSALLQQQAELSHSGSRPPPGGRSSGGCGAGSSSGSAVDGELAASGTSASDGDAAQQVRGSTSMQQQQQAGQVPPGLLQVWEGRWVSYSGPARLD